MRNEGLLIISGPDGQRTERATLLCPHCNGMIVVREPPEEPDIGRFCQRCMKHICKKPACNATCIPFERALEEYERKAERRSALLRAVTGD